MRNIKSECKSEFETAQASMPESPYQNRPKTPWDDPGSRAVLRLRISAKQEAAAAAALAEVRNEYFRASAAARQQLEQQHLEQQQQTRAEAACRAASRVTSRPL